MAATYEPIASTTVGADTTSVSFTSIPGTYTDLRLIVFEPVASSNSNGIRLNGDTGTNYSRTVLRGNGSTAFSARASNENWMYMSGAPQAAVQTHEIMSYSNVNVYKTVLHSGLNLVSAAQTIQRQVSLWRSTSAVTQIEYGGGVVKAGTVLSLYGIKAA